MTKRIILFGFIAVLGLSLVGCATFGGMKTPEPLKGFDFTTVEQIVAMEDFPEFYFCQGPTQYLMTRQDEKTWKQVLKIEDPGKRSSTEKDFLKCFWEVRDPDPSTPENEFKMAYYQNAAYAQKNFHQEYLGYGWKSDRGKILLILGPADWESKSQVDMFQLDFEEKYTKEHSGSIWSDSTEEILGWQYQKLEYLPNLMMSIYFHNGPETIYFRRGWASGWQLAVQSFDSDSGWEVVVPVHYYPEYLTALEKIFEFMRNEYIFDKNTEFSIPN